MKNLGVIIGIIVVAALAGFFCTIGIKSGESFSKWAGTKWEEHKVKAAERKAEREAKAEAAKLEAAAKKAAATPTPAKA